MIKSYKQIGIILRTHGKESNSLFLQKLVSSVATLLSLDNGDSITNPYGIANAFNN